MAEELKDQLGQQDPQNPQESEQGGQQLSETKSGLEGQLGSVGQANDYINAEQYYKNQVNNGMAGQAITESKKAEAINKSMESARYVQQNAAKGVENFTRAEYQANQSSDKAGHAGGYVLDAQRQMQYLRSSIQADLFSQQELQKLGYESNLTQARWAAELEKENLALQRWQSAEQVAISKAQVTGSYIAPQISDMMTQLGAAQSILAGAPQSENEYSEEQRKAKAVENFVISELQKYIDKNGKDSGSIHNEWSDSFDEGYNNKFSEEWNKKFNESWQQKFDEVWNKLTGEGKTGDEASVEAKKQADEFAKQQADSYVSSIDKDIINAGHTNAEGKSTRPIVTINGVKTLAAIEAESNKAMAEAQQKYYEAEAEKMKVELVQAVENTRQQGNYIPMFTDDGKVGGYTNQLPTTDEGIAKLKDYMASNGGAAFSQALNQQLANIAKQFGAFLAKEGNENATFAEFMQKEYSGFSISDFIDTYGFVKGEDGKYSEFKFDGDTTSKGGITVTKDKNGKWAITDGRGSIINDQLGQTEDTTLPDGVKIEDQFKPDGGGVITDPFKHTAMPELDMSGKTINKDTIEQAIKDKGKDYNHNNYEEFKESGVLISFDDGTYTKATLTFKLNNGQVITLDLSRREQMYTSDWKYHDSCIKASNAVNTAFTNGAVIVADDTGSIYYKNDKDLCIKTVRDQNAYLALKALKESGYIDDSMIALI